MPLSSNHGTTKAKDLRMLLPFTCNSLRIPNKLADEIGAGPDDDSVEVLLVGPYSKVWRIEVGWDGDGAFLGRGWLEFADVCGVEAGWLLVLRHRGRGVLTVKAFDAARCLREFGTSPQNGKAIMSGGDTISKPQFIRILSQGSMEKMLIPAKFVEYILKEQLDNSIAIVFGPVGQACRIKLRMERSGMFFAGGWSEFLSSHAITKDDSLLIRYEGKMKFIVKVFDSDGFFIQSSQHNFEIQNGPILPGIIKQEEATSSKNDWASSEGQKKPGGYIDSVTKASKAMLCVYNTGPPAWVKKEMNASTVKSHLALPASFCEAIGLWEVCTITLKTSLSSSNYWQVGIHPYKNSSHRVMSGWRKFCRDNGIKVGDVCTMKVIEPKLWHVVIERL